jgi:endonuclease/exonuclease/phosphatase family metal-dependent hydrolase
MHASAPANSKPTGLTEFQTSLDLDRIYVKGDAPVPARASAGAIRVMTWNIRHGHEPARIAEAIRKLNPDVACLQEVDWNNERTGYRDVLEELARQVGMLGLFGIEFLELRSPKRDVRLAGGGATGNAVLTRFQPGAVFRLPLPAGLDWERGAADPRLPWMVRRRIRREPRIGQRFGLGVELTAGGRRIVIGCLHLEDKSGGVSGRWSQYTAAREAIEARCDASAIRVIAGDFNTFNSRLARLFRPVGRATALGQPSGATEAQWWKTALLPPTGYTDEFPAEAWSFAVTPFFRAKLDWITTRGGQVRACGVGPFASSDHRPLWIDLDLGNGASAA